MISSLVKGDVDAAFVLTDCAVAAISRDAGDDINTTPPSGIRLVAQIVASPLVWGVVSKSPTAPSTDVDIDTDIEKLPWAVSRHGSGSDVMLKVYTGEATTKVCGNFDGMVASVLRGETRGFLWETSTTRGLLRKRADGDRLSIVDTVTTPWAAFVCVVAANTPQPKTQRVKACVAAFLAAAHKWKRAADTAGSISRKYGMSPDEAAAWVRAVQFPAAQDAEFDMHMLEKTKKTLVTAKVIAPEKATLKLRDFILQ